MFNHFNDLSHLMSVLSAYYGVNAEVSEVDGLVLVLLYYVDKNGHRVPEEDGQVYPFEKMWYGLDQGKVYLAG